MGRDWALELPNLCLVRPKNQGGVFAHRGFLPHRVCAMLKCVYWTRAQRRKDPSVLGHSFLCAGWEASILLAYQSNESPLEAHQVSRAPLVHRVGHVTLLPLPTISFSYCSNSCSFFFFPVICCYILPLFELPIIWFSFSLVLFFFFFLFSFFPVICSFLFLLELPESVICKNQ